MVDSWACELETPKLSDTNSLDDYCIPMQECVTQYKSCNRQHNPIEETRMYLRNLDNLSFKEVKNSLLQELRGQFAEESYLKHNLHLVMLPKPMQKHHLHVKLEDSHAIVPHSKENLKEEEEKKK